MSASIRYTGPARLLHWVMAAIVILVLCLGLYLWQVDPEDGPLKDWLYFLHENFGVLIFLLVLVRIVTRLRHPAPPLPADVPPLVRLAARTTQFLLYAVLLVQSIAGFLATNAWGFPLDWFGVVPLPSPIGKNDAMANAMSALHLAGGLSLLGLICLHITGAAYHGLVRRDGVLHRML